MTIQWLTAFLDTPRAEAADAERFWLDVTGWQLSARRGDRGEFATLLPPDADAMLRVQVLDHGRPGSHLDLHVTDVGATAAAAVAAGARIVHEEHGEQDDLVVLHSPAGLPFCVSGAYGTGRRPRSSTLVDQLCLDVPATSFDAEARWWSEFTGWALHPSGPGFVHLDRPDGMPLRLLVQRLDDGPPGAHLDLACADRSAAVRDHVALGATVDHATDLWTTLRDPSGRAYCLTDRDPRTGRLP